MYAIRHKGIFVEASISDAEPDNGVPTILHIDSFEVKDWDEFAAWWGIYGETPILAPSLQQILNLIETREEDEIAEIIFDIARDDCDF